MSITIREPVVRYRRPRRAPDQIKNAETAARFAARLLDGDGAREHLIAIYLDTGHAPIGYQVVSIGTVDQALAHPREIFRPALLLGAAALVLVHNHPSGDLSPSENDRRVRECLTRAGELLGVQLLDFLTIDDRGRYRAVDRIADHTARLTPSRGMQ